MNDNTKYQYKGLKWLMEMELLNDPQAINTLKLNILMTSKRIKEVELLIYRENKTMLVLLDLTWIGRKFFKKTIFEEVEGALVQLLPSFRFRVTDDTKIMGMAIAKVKKALIGGSNENPSNRISSNDPGNISNPNVSNATATSQIESTSPNSIKADQKE